MDHQRPSITTNQEMDPRGCPITSHHHHHLRVDPTISIIPNFKLHCLESLEHNRRERTSAVMKNYPQLLRKFLADKAKVSSLVEMMVHLKLELYSLKRQEQAGSGYLHKFLPLYCLITLTEATFIGLPFQNFGTVVQLIKDAFFKHGEKDTLRSCINALMFCSTESQGELQDFVQSKLKELENVLMVKLKFAIKEAEVGDEEYPLPVNLNRLYELQLATCVSNERVVGFLLLNMYLHVAWCLHSIDSENPSEASVPSLLSNAQYSV